MPLRSKKQRRFLFAKKPDIAAEFAKKATKGKKIPESIGRQLSALKKRVMKR